MNLVLLSSSAIALAHRRLRAIGARARSAATLFASPAASVATRHVASHARVRSIGTSVRSVGVRGRAVAGTALDHIDAVAIVLVLAVLIAFVALDLSGHRLFVVSGGSMEPAIARGSLVVVRPAFPTTIAVGDVVTFDHRGQTVTHRVAVIDETAGSRIFTTKGDANEIPDPDPITFQDRVGVLVAQVPLLGYVLALTQWAGRPLSLATGLFLAAWSFRRHHSRPFPDVALPPQVALPDAASPEASRA